MTVRSPFLPIALLLLAAASGGGCDAVSGLVGDGPRPSARIVGVSVSGLGLNGLDLTFDVDVENPYGVGLPIAALDYALASRGATFLRGSADDQGIVPARGNRVIPVSARVAFRELLSAVSGVRPGAVVPYDAELGISVDAPALGRLRLPVRKEGTLPIPTVPRISLDSVSFGKLTLAEATAELVLGISNGNDFGVDLSALNYALKLAGTSIVESGIRKELELGEKGAGTLRIPVSFKPSSLGFAAFRMLSGSGASWFMDGQMVLDTAWGRTVLPFTGSGDTKFER